VFDIQASDGTLTGGKQENEYLIRAGLDPQFRMLLLAALEALSTHSVMGDPRAQRY